MTKKYWCLFCPELFDTTDDLMEHMKNIAHSDGKGGIAFYNPHGED